MTDCERCDGTGVIGVRLSPREYADSVDCPVCDGTGEVEWDEDYAEPEPIHEAYDVRGDR